MFLTGAASASLRPVLAGPPRPARFLGAAPAALYLATAGRAGSGVVAVLAHDAVRLPCGVLLPSTSAELPLTAIAPAPGDDCQIGSGRITWPGADIRVVREWAPAVAPRSAVRPARLAQARPLLPPGPADPDPARLLGLGPGLTPSGDDLLAGFLVGARAFGIDAARLRHSVAAQAAARTTALSAALLWHAARGECIDQVAALAAALAGRGEVGPAVTGLLSVGHTSGAALGCGLVMAAEWACHAR